LFSPFFFVLDGLHCFFLENFDMIYIRIIYHCYAFVRILPSY
jgi:hypothetical protein